MAPLHPGLMGVFFKVFGASGRAAAWCCGLWFMLTCAVTYLLALKVFNRAVAVLATIIVATDAALLRYAVSGLETSLLTLLVTLLFAVLYFHWESDRARLGLSAAAGLLVGLIYLTDYPWIALFIPVLIVVWANSRGKGAAANAIAFIALCVIVTAPWTIRNYTLTGRLLPYRCTEAAMGTLSYPANTLYRSFAPPEFSGVLKYAASAPREMYSKLRSNLMQMLPMVAGLGGLFVGAFFWVAILVPFGGDGFSRARYVLYGTLLLLIVTLSVLGITGRSLAPLRPRRRCYGYRALHEPARQARGADGRQGAGALAQLRHRAVAHCASGAAHADDGARFRKRLQPGNPVAAFRRRAEHAAARGRARHHRYAVGRRVVRRPSRDLAALPHA